MTDPVDDPLRRAGDRWRSHRPGPPDLEPARSRRSAWRRPVIGVAAATVALSAGGYALTARLTATGGSHDTTATVSATARSGTSRAADLVVRDGDRVRASGLVVAAPGRPIRFCAPAVTAGFGAPDDAGVPTCDHGVTVTGVDLTGLDEASERAGVRYGSASLEGVLRGGALVVTGQTAPAPPETTDFPPTPCDPPAGGWRAVHGVDGKELHRYVEVENPDRFRRPWISHPSGVPTGATPGPSTVEVLVVEVVRGELDTVRRELGSRYPGNLCVVSDPGRPSLADQAETRARVQPALDELMRDAGSGVYAAGGTDRVSVEMVVLTPALHERFSDIGIDLLDLRPWLRPVRHVSPADGGTPGAVTDVKGG